MTPIENMKSSTPHVSAELIHQVVNGVLSGAAIVSIVVAAREIDPTLTVLASPAWVLGMAYFVALAYFIATGAVVSVHHAALGCEKAHFSVR